MLRALAFGFGVLRLVDAQKMHIEVQYLFLKVHLFLEV